MQHRRSNKDNIGSFISILDHLITKKEKAVFCSNRSKLCQSLKCFIESEDPSIKILLICQETQHDQRVIAFKKNSNEEAKKYQLIIISPTITSGVSVVDEEFTASFSAFNSSTISHFAAIQQIHRFRSVKKHNILLMTLSKNEKQDISLKEAKEALKYNDHQMTHNTIYDYHFMENKKKENISKSSFAQCFISRIFDLGYSVNINKDIDKSALSSFDISENIEENEEKRREKILMSERVSFKEYNTLKLRERLNDEELYQVLHYDACLMLNLPESFKLTSDYLNALGENFKNIGTIRRNAILMNSIDCEHSEDNEINNVLPFNKRRFPFHVMQFSQAAIELIFGEFDFNGIIKSRATFSNSTLKDFAEMVEDNSIMGVFVGLLSKERVKVSKKEYEKSEPVLINEKGRSKVARDFLLKIGIKTIKHSRTQINGKDEIIYCIDEDHAKIMNDLIIFQREKTRQIKEKREEKILLSKREEDKKINKDIGIKELSFEEFKILQNELTITSKMHELVEIGNVKAAYCCSSCLMPTNEYTCISCGNKEVRDIKKFGFRAIKTKAALESILKAKGFILFRDRYAENSINSFAM